LDSDELFATTPLDEGTEQAAMTGEAFRESIRQANVAAWQRQEIERLSSLEKQQHRALCEHDKQQERHETQLASLRGQLGTANRRVRLLEAQVGLVKAERESLQRSLGSLAEASADKLEHRREKEARARDARRWRLDCFRLEQERKKAVEAQRALQQDVKHARFGILRDLLQSPQGARVVLLHADNADASSHRPQQPPCAASSRPGCRLRAGVWRVVRALHGHRAAGAQSELQGIAQVTQTLLRTMEGSEACKLRQQQRISTLEGLLHSTSEGAAEHMKERLKVEQHLHSLDEEHVALKRDTAVVKEKLQQATEALAETHRQYSKLEDAHAAEKRARRRLQLKLAAALDELEHLKELWEEAQRDTPSLHAAQAGTERGTPPHDTHGASSTAQVDATPKFSVHIGSGIAPQRNGEKEEKHARLARTRTRTRTRPTTRSSALRHSGGTGSTAPGSRGKNAPQGHKASHRTTMPRGRKPQRERNPDMADRCVESSPLRAHAADDGTESAAPTRSNFDVGQHGVELSSANTRSAPTLQCSPGPEASTSVERKAAGKSGTRAQPACDATSRTVGANLEEQLESKQKGAYDSNSQTVEGKERGRPTSQEDAQGEGDVDDDMVNELRSKLKQCYEQLRIAKRDQTNKRARIETLEADLQAMKQAVIDSYRSSSTFISSHAREKRNVATQVACVVCGCEEIRRERQAEAPRFQKVASAADAAVPSHLPRARRSAWAERMASLEHEEANLGPIGETGTSGAVSFAVCSSLLQREYSLGRIES